MLFPMSVVPINVGRPRSVRLVEELLGQENAMVGVLTQKNSETVEPTFEDLYTIGTLARVVKVIRLGPSNYSVVLNGLGRFRMQGTTGLEPYMTAEVERITELDTEAPGFANFDQWLSGTQLERELKIKEYSVSNRGLRPGLVGTPEKIRARIEEFSAAGLDLLLLQMSPQLEEMERFSRQVIQVTSDS